MFFNPQSSSTHSDSQSVSAISVDNTMKEEFYIDINDGLESCALFILFNKNLLQTLLIALPDIGYVMNRKYTHFKRKGQFYYCFIYLLMLFIVQSGLNQSHLKNSTAPFYGENIEGDNG